MYNVRAFACVIKLIEMCLSNKNRFLAIMEKFFKHLLKLPPKNENVFLDKYGIVDVSGKAICVVCSKKLDEESLKPNKLQRHMETHANITVMSEEARKRVFHYRYKNLTKSQAVLCRALSQKENIEIFSYKTAFLIAQHKRPFTKGETIIKLALKNFCEILNHLLERHMKLLMILLLVIIP